MPLSDAARLRLLATDALAAAARMTDPHCRRSMMGLAASYERLADHAEERQPAPPRAADLKAETRRRWPT